MATYLYRLGRWSYDRRRIVLGALAGRAGRRRRARRRVLGPDQQQVRGPGHRVPAGAGAARAEATRRRAAPTPASSSPLPKARRSTTPRTRPPSRRRWPRPRAPPRSAASPKLTLSQGRARSATPTSSTPCPRARSPRRRARSSPTIAATGEQAGLQVEFSGGIAAEEAEHGSESMGMMVAYLVLAITLASLLAAGMPLLTAALGVVHRHHGPDRALGRDRPVGDRSGAGHDARPRGRHRLRAVHPRPPQPEPRRRHGVARVRRPGHRHRRQRRRVRRRHRRSSRSPACASSTSRS